MSKRIVINFIFAFVLLGVVAPVSAKQINFDDATIAELNAAFEAGTLTAEKLVQLCLDRIEAFDRQGPNLHAVISVNPNALEIARALDKERAEKGPRSPVHGIPVIMKDNYDTVDMPTTGGSVLLEGSMAPDDAFMVKKLRDGGAIILAKVNLGEFANGFQSSLGGQSLNPHDLTRTPGGSSGGTGVGIAAGYAPIGLGTDTGGSIRGPSTINGVVGLKPTHGLLSHDGIIPLALSLDMGGPMTRSVYDAAVALGVMTGIDPADPYTDKSKGKFHTDYTQFLDANALRGARLGVVRDFAGFDPDVDWVFNAALKAMEKAGATLVDVHYPKWFLESASDMLWSIYPPEFKVQIAEYLKTTGPEYPKSLDDLIERSYEHTSLGKDGSGANPYRWNFFHVENASGSLTEPGYVAAHDYGMPMSVALINGIFAQHNLDALVYPTALRRPPQIASANVSSGGGGVSTTVVGNLTGFPDLIVPAGFTTDDLPVTVSFLGQAFEEPKILALGYAFEQATQAIRRPVNTPALPGEMIEVPD